MRVDFVTLFPEMVLGALRHSVINRAETAGLVRFGAVNPRDYCYDRHAKVDDAPFGGEPGMLIRAEPVALAIESLPKLPRCAVVLPSPTGALFTQKGAQDLASFDQVVFVCGHYEGIDHRIETSYVTHSFSLGDFIVTNGEMPAIIMADALVRLIPGVLGSADSLKADSFSDGLLSAPNYTRPEVWRGQPVPDVLRSGNHRAIVEWRRKQSLNLTAERRPDLLAKAALTQGDVKLLVDEK